MQFKKVIVASAGFVASARSTGPDGDKDASITTTHSGVVIVDVFPAVSISTAYSTDYVTSYSCPGSVTDCPLSGSASVVTSVVPMSTTVCPLTLTTIATSGQGPRASSGADITSGILPPPPAGSSAGAVTGSSSVESTSTSTLLETITRTRSSTVTISSAPTITTFSAPVPSSSGPSSSASGLASSSAGAASSSVSSAQAGSSSAPVSSAPVSSSSSAVPSSSEAGAVTGAGSSSSAPAESTSGVVLTSTVTSTTQITLPSPPSSMLYTTESPSGTLVNATQSSIPVPGASSGGLTSYSYSVPSSSLAGAIGATGTGTGMIPGATANGTFTNASPSVVPYTGTAGQDFEQNLLLCMAIGLVSAVLLI